jgi:hypothetical protein
LKFVFFFLTVIFSNSSLLNGHIFMNLSFPDSHIFLMIIFFKNHVERESMRFYHHN